MRREIQYLNYFKLKLQYCIFVAFIDSIIGRKTSSMFTSGDTLFPSSVYGTRDSSFR